MVPSLTIIFDDCCKMTLILTLSLVLNEPTRNNSSLWTVYFVEIRCLKAQNPKEQLEKVGDEGEAGEMGGKIGIGSVGHP